MSTTAKRRALVTGATGYVGAMLVPHLLREGWEVRVLTRDAATINRDWEDDVDVVEGSADSPECLQQALQDIDVAYYLIHSMDGQPNFEQHDKQLAQLFAAQAKQAGVGRIVYLGGLHPSGVKLSTHLQSRTDVGQELLRSGVPTAVLQAAIIIGNGSASFAMLRYLTSRLPVMAVPQWLHNKVQPIAIEDVLYYLVKSADLPKDVNRSFDIGGPEVLTYVEMMQRFAKVNGLSQRLMVTIPAITPQLASHWVTMVTPIAPGLVKPLVDSLVHDVVCQENDIQDYVGQPVGGLAGFNESVRRAMRFAAPDYGPRNLARAVGTGAAVGLAIGLVALLLRRRKNGKHTVSLPLSSREVSWRTPSVKNLPKPSLPDLSALPKPSLPDLRDVSLPRLPRARRRRSWLSRHRKVTAAAAAIPVPDIDFSDIPRPHLSRRKKSRFGWGSGRRFGLFGKKSRLPQVSAPSWLPDVREKIANTDLSMPEVPKSSWHRDSPRRKLDKAGAARAAAAVNLAAAAHSEQSDRDDNDQAADAPQHTASCCSRISAKKRCCCNAKREHAEIKRRVNEAHARAAESKKRQRISGLAQLFIPGLLAYQRLTALRQLKR